MKSVPPRRCDSSTRSCSLDLDAMRRRLRGIEGLCREASTTADLLVLRDSLRVLRLAVAQIGELR